jgi:hypothetical protein
MNFILDFIGPLPSDKQLVIMQLVRKLQARFEVPSVMLLAIQVF